MTREIKFRAWSKNENKFVDDFIIDRLGNEYQYNKCEFWGDDRDVVVMQYTGLKDKNDEEIYEGDIVRRYINSRGKMYKSNFERNIIPVVFENFAWNIRKQTDRLEIIGNIYENPEIIK